MPVSLLELQRNQLLCTSLLPAEMIVLFHARQYSWFLPGGPWWRVNSYTLHSQLALGILCCTLRIRLSSCVETEVSGGRGYMKRQQAFVTFVAAISVLAGAGLLLLVQRVTDRYGSDSQSLIISLKAAVGQNEQSSQLWDEDTPLDWEEGASLLESSTSRTMEDLRVGEARQRKTQGSGPLPKYRVSRQAVPLVQSKKAWQVRAPQQQGGPWTKGRERSGPVLGCKQFQSQNFSWPQDMQSIAVVGNGPLTEQSRQEINGMDLVIRFNKLQSYRCGEKFDVWASRHGDAVSTRYWGIGQKLDIAGCSMGRLLALSKHIWLMNGGDGPFNYFLQSYPSIKERANYLWVDCRAWVAQYMAKYDPRSKIGLPASSQDEVSPSSGWLVIMLVKDCAPKNATLHVYGFNWPGGQWPAHKADSERTELLEMTQNGGFILHQTECKHKYRCGPEVGPKGL